MLGPLGDADEELALQRATATYACKVLPCCDRPCHSPMCMHPVHLRLLHMAAMCVHVALSSSPPPAGRALQAAQAHVRQPVRAALLLPPDRHGAAPAPAHPAGLAGRARWVNPHLHTQQRPIRLCQTLPTLTSRCDWHAMALKQRPSGVIIPPWLRWHQARLRAQVSETAAGGCVASWPEGCRCRSEQDPGPAGGAGGGGGRHAVQGDEAQALHPG